MERSMIVRLVLILVLLSCPLFSQQKYILECREDLLMTSREILIQQIGIEEQGRNDGEMIRRYLASVGLKQGIPYCAAGQYWCFYEACRLLNISKSFIPLPRTGLANGFFTYAQKKGHRSRFFPKIDDLLIWRKPKSIHGHVERIISVDSGGWVTTVGFNTRKKINGEKVEGVFTQRRNIYHPLRRMYVRGLVGFFTGDKNDT